MSTEIEITDPNDSETDDAVATFEESEAPIDLGADSDHDESAIDTEETDDTEDSEDVDTSMGEWSLCASMIFLAGYLVVLLFWVLDHSVWETLISFDREVYRTEFPVGVATIILLISVLSTFCSFISLVADKNNRKTLLIRLLTLGPLLPLATTGFMIWIIIQRGAGNSILENFLG
ncbi:MAG: hypothetical protein OSA92_05540 [Pirellulaceae bacterium]|nr:hypothetical protein [Pirellulaceae bacterium]